MNYSDQLRFIASGLAPDLPDTAVMLENIAIGVRRLERTLDEIVAEAQQEEHLLANKPPPGRPSLRVVP